MRFRIMSIKTLLLAGVLSLAAVSAAYATDGPPPGAGGSNGHASAAPACGYECPVLAGDGGPGSPTDGTGRSGARVATEGAPSTPGDKNGSAALSQGGGEFLVASIKGGMSGDF
jgi:hypothetical protein